MKLSVYLLPLLVALTACSSTTKQPLSPPQPVSQTQNTATHSPTIAVIESDTPKQADIKENLSTLESNKIEKSRSIATGKPAVAIEPTIKSIIEPIIEPIDIWQRMRQGYGLPPMNSKLVAKHEGWNRKHHEYVQTMLQRSDKYLFHIVEQIEKRNMPMEIALLPAIESAYRAKARSRSNASGLWQFIPATGKYLGMRQDWWSDQRRDILISTEAALDYLLSLHDEFNGDWLLALAAYNGGKGTIAKAIKANKRKNKPTNLESLSLRQETTHYVPKLIALSNVVMNPDLYGIQLPNIANVPYFTVQETSGQTDLTQLIKNTELSRKDIDELNPSFLRWASDPKGPHRILVPIHLQASVAHYLKTAPELSQLNWREHHIRKGETVGQIARKYSVSASAIRSINGMKNNNIRAGKTLLIPIEAKFSKQLVKSRQTKNVIKSSHQVKKGDTLWDIAKRYNLSVSDLTAWNKISKSHTLTLNQIIKLSN